MVLLAVGEAFKAIDKKRRENFLLNIQKSPGQRFLDSEIY
jgi:hypothetical protein